MEEGRCRRMNPHWEIMCAACATASEGFRLTKINYNSSPYKFRENVIFELLVDLWRLVITAISIFVAGHRHCQLLLLLLLLWLLQIPGFSTSCSFGDYQFLYCVRCPFSMCPQRRRRANGLHVSEIFIELTLTRKGRWRNKLDTLQWRTLRWQRGSIEMRIGSWFLSLRSVRGRVGFGFRFA